MTAGIQDNLKLTVRVCADCNTYFDKYLDRPLAKDSIHGLDRLQQGMTPINTLCEYTGRSVEMQTASADAYLDGPPVQVIDRNGQVAYALKAHLVLEGKGDNKLLRLFKEDLVKGLDSFDFSRVTGRVKAWAETDEEERELWELAQIHFTKAGHPLQVTGTYIPGTVPVFAEIEFGLREFRTFAKIAFNYMAKMTEHIPTFVLQDCFTGARRFVRYGDAPGYKIVEPIGNVGRYGLLGQEQYPMGHFVDLRLYRNGINYEVAGRVTLFNRFGWLIHLCRDYQGLHHDIDRMHHWNFETMRCEPFAGGSITTRNN